jgi:molybdopterin-guanine dinucleotide biosynthesis protein A
VRGCVLAGGAGTRLGGMKATAELAGRPLISYPLAALARAGLDPIVVAKPETELPGMEAQVLHEPPGPRHPLAGIVAALRHLDGPILACACDLPFVTPELARHVAGRGGGLVVPFAAGRPQPLFARYEPGLLPELEQALAADHALTATVEALDPMVLPESELARFGDPARLFANVNTPAELEAASAGDPFGERP